MLPGGSVTRFALGRVDFDVADGTTAERSPSRSDHGVDRHRPTGPSHPPVRRDCLHNGQSPSTDIRQVRGLNMRAVLSPTVRDVDRHAIRRRRPPQADCTGPVIQLQRLGVPNGVGHQLANDEDGVVDDSLREVGSPEVTPHQVPSSGNAMRRTGELGGTIAAMVDDRRIRHSSLPGAAPPDATWPYSSGARRPDKVKHRPGG